MDLCPALEETIQCWNKRDDRSTQAAGAFHIMRVDGMRKCSARYCTDGRGCHKTGHYRLEPLLKSELRVLFCNPKELTFQSEDQSVVPCVRTSHFYGVVPKVQHEKVARVEQLTEQIRAVCTKEDKERGSLTHATSCLVRMY